MNRKIGVAALLSLLAVGALSTNAFSVCNALLPCSGGPCPVFIQFDADCFAYETAYTKTGFNSSPGSQMTIVGIITSFNTPLGFLNAADPLKEYTFVVTGLTSQGTIVSLNGPTTNYDTNYDSLTVGSFTIWEGSPRNAPTAGTMNSNPPGGLTVPANFQDGTAILTGTLCGFHTNVSKTGSIVGGSFRATYHFTNPNAPGPPPVGNLFNAVGDGEGAYGGNWCANLAGCTPTGYSAHPNGKWDLSPTTAVSPSTWGRLKSLYR